MMLKGMPYEAYITSTVYDVCLNLILLLYLGDVCIFCQVITEHVYLLLEEEAKLKKCFVPVSLV